MPHGIWWHDMHKGSMLTVIGYIHVAIIRAINQSCICLQEATVCTTIDAIDRADNGADSCLSVYTGRCMRSRGTIDRRDRSLHVNILLGNLIDVELVSSNVAEFPASFDSRHAWPLNWQTLLGGGWTDVFIHTYMRASVYECAINRDVQLRWTH